MLKLFPFDNFGTSDSGSHLELFEKSIETGIVLSFTKKSIWKINKPLFSQLFLNLSWQGSKLLRR